MTVVRPVPETPATYDIFAEPHRAIRLSLTGLLVRLGAVRAGDEAAVFALLDDLRGQLVMSAAHLHHEGEAVHAALAPLAPGAAADMEMAHGRARQTLETVAHLIFEVRFETAELRPGALRRLYLAFSRFVADELHHMAEEEEDVLPLLQALFTDAELADLEHRIAHPEMARAA